MDFVLLLAWTFFALFLVFAFRKSRAAVYLGWMFFLTMLIGGIVDGGLGVW